MVKVQVKEKLLQNEYEKKSMDEITELSKSVEKVLAKGEYNEYLDLISIVDDINNYFDNTKVMDEDVELRKIEKISLLMF